MLSVALKRSTSVNVQMETILMMRKSLFNGLGVLQAFIGVGAVAGRLGLTLDPSGAVGEMDVTSADLDEEQHV